MTDLKDGLSSKSLLRTTGAVVLVLLLTHVCGGQLQRTPPKVVVMLGDDTVLPCQLEPPTNAVQMTIEWGRNDLNPRFVYVWHDGRELLTDQNEAYTGRASLDINKLKQGDISLRLSTVKVSDNGTYRCYLPKQSQEYFIDLVVGAVSSPTISLAGLDKSISAVVLECESKGWYPEPEVLWLDGEGNLLSAGPTETVRGPDDLYTVSSRVTVEKRHSNSFTCRVQQDKTNQTREAEIGIPDEFFMAPSNCAASITFSVLLCLMLILAVSIFVWKWRQNKTEREKKKKNTTEQQHLMESKEIKKTEDLDNIKVKSEELQKREGEKKDVVQVIYTLMELSKELGHQKDQLTFQMQRAQTAAEESEHKVNSVEKEVTEKKGDKTENKAQGYLKVIEIAKGTIWNLRERNEELQKLQMNTEKLIKRTYDEADIIAKLNKLGDQLNEIKQRLQDRRTAETDTERINTTTKQNSISGCTS
uniref:Ig-like domain-containing protein n=1 Tax=Lates calcarifer TaxID=8187 RepID=A0A4W6CEK5_LATCA